MNKSIGLQLVGYSLILSGLSYLVHHLAPTLARPTLLTGLAGGVLCLVWGLRGIAGHRGKALPLLTLIPVSFVMLSQAVLTWGGERTGATPPSIITGLFVLSVAMLMRIAYAGQFMTQPAGAANQTATQSQRTEKAAK